VRLRVITIMRVMPAAGGWHFVRPRAITIARLMPAAGVAGLEFYMF